MTSFNPINMNSVKDITGNNKEVLVFGTTDTGWEWIQSQLQTRKDSPVEKVFNYVIGDDIPGKEEIIPEGAVTTLEGRRIAKLSSGANHAPQGPNKEHTKTKRICKGALVNWAFEVWKRKDSAAQIPLIFTVDIDGNRHPFTVENALSKTKVVSGKKVNEIITHSEIRRLAKLCTDESIDKELREAVQKSVVFVRLKKSGNELALERLPAPWENGAWKEELTKRKEKHVKVEKEYDWRKELNARVAEERAKKKSSDAPSPSIKEKVSEPTPPSPSVKSVSPPPVKTKAEKQIESREAQAKLEKGFSEMFGPNFKLF